jgi:hypothetical protein
MSEPIGLQELRRGDIFRFADGEGGYATDLGPQYAGEHSAWCVEWYDTEGELCGRDVPSGTHPVELLRPRNDEFEKAFDELMAGPAQHSSALDRFFDKHPPPWSSMPELGGQS